METKICPAHDNGVGRKLPISEFYRLSQDRGLFTNCKACTIKNQIAARKRLPEERRIAARAIRHGFDPNVIIESWRAWVAKGSLCESCGNKVISYKTLHLDHNHKTHQFRGWLCSSCNQMFGNAKDDPKRLRMGACYLESH